MAAVVVRVVGCLRELMVLSADCCLWGVLGCVGVGGCVGWAPGVRAPAPRGAPAAAST